MWKFLGGFSINEFVVIPLNKIIKHAGKYNISPRTVSSREFFPCEASSGKFCRGKLRRMMFRRNKKSYYDWSEADCSIFTNIVEDLVGEPARPSCNAFQTLISQELLELSCPKLNHI